MSSSTELFVFTFDASESSFESARPSRFPRMFVERHREMGEIGKDASVKSSLDHGREALLGAVSKAKGDTH